MARERIPANGFTEPDDSSALSLVPEGERDWYLKTHQGPWAYCAAVQTICREKVGFSIDPLFRWVKAELGELLYECRAQWHSGSVPIALTSGMCASTKEAFERICAQAKALPPGEALNWRLVLSEELQGFRGMGAPRFANTTELGIPTIVCTLRWGNSTTWLEAISQPYPSRMQAFHDAIAQARLIGPLPVPAPPIKQASPKSKEPTPTKPMDWERAARRHVKNNVSPLKVSFSPGKSGQTVCCKIRWGKGLKSSVESFPMPNQDEAFDQAVQIFKRDLSAQLSKTTPKIKCDAVQDVPVVKVTDPLDAQARALLDLAKRHWSVEHAWLMGKSPETKERIQRLHDLNTFLVLLDPLRCYEIDRGARDVAIGRIAVELQRIHSDQSKLRTSIRYTTHLRSLLGERFAEAGTKVTLTAAFAAHAMSSGIKPEQAIAELVQAQLLRQFPSGELTISTLGANLLERNLSAEIKSGTLGSALPQGVALMLLNLKDSLLSNAC